MIKTPRPSAVLGLGLLFVLGLAAGAAAQDDPIAFVGSTVVPIVGDPIENGVVVVEDGKITAVGDSGTRIPRGAERIDVSGKFVLPGYVDTHSHVGGPIAKVETSRTLRESGFAWSTTSSLTNSTRWPSWSGSTAPTKKWPEPAARWAST